MREEDGGGGRHSLGSYTEMDGSLGSRVVSVSQVNVPSRSQPRSVGQPVGDRSTRPAHRTTLPKGPLQQKYILRGIILLDTKRPVLFMSNSFSVPSKNDHARRECPFPAHAGCSGPEGASNPTQHSSDPQAMSKPWTQQATAHCCSSVTIFFFFFFGIRKST